MTESRIKPLNQPYGPEVSEDLTAMMPPGIEPLKLFRTLAHNPRVLRKFRMGNLLDRGSIDRRDRELIILRTCARCGAEYEWGVHAAFFAGRFGITENQLAATVSGTPEDSCWPEKDRLLIRLADELHETSGISGELWTEISNRWEPDQIIEFIVLVGFYHTVSYVINGLGVELEEGTPRFG